MNRSLGELEVIRGSGRVAFREQTLQVGLGVSDHELLDERAPRETKLCRFLVDSTSDLLAQTDGKFGHSSPHGRTTIFQSAFHSTLLC